WVLRLIPSIALILIISICYNEFSKLYSNRSKFLIVWLLLGSPLLMSFSERVMLDLPFIALSIAILFFAVSGSAEKMYWLWILSGIAWWFREIAVLPILFASLLSIALGRTFILKNTSFWLSSLWFLMMV